MISEKIISLILVLALVTGGVYLSSSFAGDPEKSKDEISIPFYCPETVTGTDPTVSSGSSTRGSRIIEKDFFLDEAQLIVQGGNSYDYAGYSLAFGDIDADGYHDLIIGVPYGDGSDTATRTSAGEVLVYFGNGNQTFPGTIRDRALSQYDLIIYGRTGTTGWGGSNSGCIVGFDVATGDINGDGYDDIVMGAPGAELNPNNRRDAGAVYVTYGDDRDKLGPVIDLASDLDFAIYGVFQETQCGRSVAVGDFDKDGFDDIIVGEQYADPGNKVNAGNAYVVFGDSALGTHEDLWRGAQSADTITISGDKGRAPNDEGDQAGYDVAAGDVNGDGYDDIIVGAPTGQMGGGRVNAGAVYVIQGASTMSQSYDLASDARVNIWGDDANDYSGVSIAAGDIDGDQMDDILIGAIYADGVPDNKWGAGDMFIVYGGLSMAQNIDLRTDYGAVVYGRNDWDILGQGFATGKLDGDKYEDFIVGARLNNADSSAIADAGAAYVFHGASRSSLGSTLDPVNDAAGQLYGVNKSDQVGFAMAIGDFDSDGAGDIAVMGYSANGPLEARDDCGEVYLVYGKAPPVRINSIDVLDSSGKSVSTIYSKYDTYTFRVNVTDILGADDLSEVVLNLDPDGEDLQYKWSDITSPFSKVKDTNAHTVLSSVSGDAVQTHTFHYEIDFKLEFGWEYPNSGILPVTVTASGVKSFESTKSFDSVFEIEDDLELIGSLKVRDEEGTMLSENSWVAGGETVDFTGMTAVYEGTTSVYPPTEEYTITVNDDYDSWTNETPSGEPMQIEAVLSPVTNVEDKFIIAISEPASESPLASRLINLSVDGEAPDPPSSIEFRRTADPPSITAVNTTGFYISWTEGEDKFSGIRGYYYSLINGEETSSGTYTTDRTGQITDAPEGQVWVYVWSVDNAGNIGKAVSNSIFVDLDDSLFSDFEPVPGNWLKNRNFNCSIIIDDREGVGVDTSSIRYRISTNGISGYESWLTLTELEQLTANRIKANVQISTDFAEGNENYIQFKGSDLAGNSITSSNYNIWLDTGEIFYQDESPNSITKQNGGKLVFTITIVDSVSGVDDNSIQYAVSTTGIKGYGDWSSDNMYPVIGAEAANTGVKYRVDLNLPPGKSNYIKWRAKDVAGNGYTESDGYRIWVNSPPVAVISSPLDDNKFKEKKSVTFSAKGSTDADNDTLSYKWRSSIDGEFGFTPELSWNKLSEGVHEITLTVDDGISSRESKITIKVEKEESALEGKGVLGASKSVDLTFIIILIVVLILIFLLFMRNKKQLKEKEEEAKRVSAELVPPSIAGAPGMPGVGVQATDYGLSPVYGTASAQQAPQLPGTGGAVPTPSETYGAAAGVPTPSPVAGAAAGAGAPSGQVTPARPQLPPSVSAEYPHLNTKQKLDLLEEKFLTGQISENLYMQLKDKYSAERASDIGLETVGEGQKDITQEPAAADTGLEFKKPSERQAAVTTPPPSTSPVTKEGDWKKEEDLLSKIQLPGKEEDPGPTLNSLTGQKKKVQK